ncbi:MAG: septal ring lytic transglycosylase RlpA family protein [Ectothiorhodospiraceae bacterium]|nr:septal ring lytic transglycosylase RlpA family protein [Ectothiorhodospiraceae bacterium]MCH8503423.1 septal ring lytic transglycosylase RlpA family protein [Ectothiorhodospiraceae bacterium]
MRGSVRVLPLAALVAALVAGCSVTPPPSTPEEDDDRDYGPAVAPDLSHVKEPEPRDEARSRYGNPASYQVFGQTYYVMDDVVEFEQEGLASWYGKKFHGRRTSSGEPYDMYAMTAAHKELPIPIFVEVTRVDNGKTIVVRVNDRGPFAEGRIIDLSYAAAQRLDMVDEGTAPVRIRTLSRPYDPESGPRQASAPAPTPALDEQLSQNAGARPAASTRMPGDVESDAWYLQAAAFSERTNADAFKTRLSAMELAPVTIHTDDNGPARYRVRMGPLESREDVNRLSEQLRERGLGERHLVIAP